MASAGDADKRAAMRRSERMHEGNRCAAGDLEVLDLGLIHR
jgi:hypothetical protein